MIEPENFPYDWSPGGKRLLTKFHAEIDQIGSIEDAAFHIMAEWRHLYFSELKAEFRNIGWTYTLARLSHLFRVPISTIRYWRKEGVRNPNYKRRARRKTSRLFVPIFDTYTGIYYEHNKEASEAYNIPLGSMYNYFVRSKRFIRLGLL